MKPKAKLYIDIPEPCDKGWDNMTPDEKGRHCERCEKTVIDFTGMTDSELVQFFIDAKGKPFCGHYLQTQVNREIILTAPARPYFHIRFGKKIAAGLLLLQALAHDTWAQVRKPSATTVAVPEQKDTQQKPLALRGRLTDRVTLKPIPDITITIAGTALNDTTDSEGWFAIPLNDTVSLPERIKFTAHYNNGNEPEGTIIRNEPYSHADMLDRKMLNMYRYPEDSFNEIVVTQYRVPLVDGKWSFRTNILTEEQLNKMPSRITMTGESTTERAGLFRKKKKKK